MELIQVKKKVATESSVEEVSTATQQPTDGVGQELSTYEVGQELFARAEETPEDTEKVRPVGYQTPKEIVADEKTSNEDKIVSLLKVTPSVRRETQEKIKLLSTDANYTWAENFDAVFGALGENVKELFTKDFWTEPQTKENIEKRGTSIAEERLTTRQRKKTQIESDLETANYEQAKSKSQKDRKSTRLNSSHQINTYAVFCLKKKKKEEKWRK